MSKYSLKVFKIKEPREVYKFKDLINHIDWSNPFYKPELILESGNQKDMINYFVLYDHGNPKILMSFYLRPILINGKDSGYCDVCSPYGYSGPLFNSDLVGTDCLENFWIMVDKWYKQNNVVSEFIRFSLTYNYIGYTGTIIPTLNNVRGKIINAEKQWINFKPKVRNNFRKAQKEKLIFKIFFEHIPNKVVSEFYNIYIDTMERNHATDFYYFPKSYFSKYIEGNPKNAAIAMVFLDDIPISTEFLLLSENTIFSYLGGTKSDYFYTRPNDFLKINVINWGRVMNKKYYVLGGGRKNDDQLYKYKKNFFPKENDILYNTGRKIILPNMYKNICDDVVDEDEINIELSESGHGYFPLYRSV